MHNNPQLPKNQKFEWTIITKQKNERTGVTNYEEEGDQNKILHKSFPHMAMPTGCNKKQRNIMLQ